MSHFTEKSTCFTVVIAGDVEWLKSVSTSSSGPPPLSVQQPVPTDVDEQHRVQQMLLAMRGMPPAGSRWAAPPVGSVGHMPTMPRAPAMHPGIPHANHVGVPPSADSAVEHSVCCRHYC